jgi:hypothetical protein
MLVFSLAVCVLAWAPWLDNEEIHDRVLREKGWIDGTIRPVENIIASDDALRDMIEYSRSHVVTDVILIRDYNVKWAPFGRWVASCEGAYYVTFWGDMALDKHQLPTGFRALALRQA